MPHLFVDISSHGLGHLAQVAPMLDALFTRVPGLRLTVRSGLSAERLRTRLHAPFEHIAGRSDFGFIMHDALRIDHAASAAAYREFHADWPAHVAAEAAFLAQLRPDRVLTDVAYLPLAGAARAGIVAWSMCSLNWADLFAHFYGDKTWAAAIHRQMLEAYRAADAFLCLTPSMPMRDFPNRRVMPPVAAPGRQRRRELHAALKLPADERLVLAAFGGFDKAIRVTGWPCTPGVHWLLPAAWAGARPDMTAFESTGRPFADLLASADAVLTKPGYGSFVEAACAGVPVLYQRRDDWPEQDCLIAWLEQNARCREVAEAALNAGDLGPSLAALWAQTPPARPRPTGVEALAEMIGASLLAPS